MPQARMSQPEGNVPTTGGASVDEVSDEEPSVEEASDEEPSLEEVTDQEASDEEVADQEASDEGEEGAPACAMSTDGSTQNAYTRPPQYSQAHPVSSETTTSTGGTRRPRSPNAADERANKVPRQRSPTALNDESAADRERIMNEQEVAYFCSLIADREKAELKAKQAAEEERKRREEKEKKEKAAENVPQEPQAGESGLITLQIRLPSGRSIRRSFRVTDTAFALNQFVMSQEDAPLEFHIRRYPNHVLSTGTKDDTQTLEQLGLAKKETLIVDEM